MRGRPVSPSDILGRRLFFSVGKVACWSFLNLCGHFLDWVFYVETKCAVVLLSSASAPLSVALGPVRGKWSDLFGVCVSEVEFDGHREGS